MKSRILRSWGFWVFAAAFAVRFIYLWESRDNPAFETPIVDSYLYVASAESLLSGQGFSDAFFFRPFLYPFLLSALFFLSNNSILWVKILQLLLGCFTCWIAYAAGRRIYNPKAGVAAGLILAFYGPLYFYEGELLAAGPAAFLSILLVFLLIRPNKNFFLIGLVSGACVLMRPTFLLMVLVCLIWLLIRTKALKKCLVSVMGLGMILLPLCFLTLSNTGRFTFLPANGGINLYIGNNKDYMETMDARMGSQWSRITDLPDRHGAGQSLWDRDRFFMSQVKAYMVEEPGLFVQGLGHKALRFFSSRELARNTDIRLFRRWSVLLTLCVWELGHFGFPFGVLLALSVMGLFFYPKKTPAFLLLSIAAYSLSIILVFASGRYRIPMVPLLALLGGAGLTGFIHNIRNPKGGLGLGLGVLVLILSSLAGPFKTETLNYEPELYAALGDSKLRTGQTGAAESFFQKAVELDPGYAEAHAELAMIHFNENRIGPAIQGYEKALSIDPEMIRALNNLASIHIQIKQLDLALEYCMQGLKIRPHEDSIHYNLANIYAIKGESQKVIFHLQQALKTNPHLKPAHFELAQILEKEGNLVEAIHHYEASEQELSSLTMGRLYFKTDQYHKCVMALKKVKNKDPNTLLMLAKSYGRTNQPHKGAPLVEEVLKTNPFLIHALVLLSDLQAESGQFQAAVKTVQKAFDLCKTQQNKLLLEELKNRLEQYQKGRRIK